jgi:hypothetical protein
LNTPFKPLKIQKVGDKYLVRSVKEVTLLQAKDDEKKQTVKDGQAISFVNFSLMAFVGFTLAAFGMKVFAK